jgi:hypothetical protein
VNDQRPQTYLVRPSGQVAGDLERRIALGRELLAELNRSALAVPERVAQFGARYWDWHDGNAELLGSVFSTDEIEQSYGQIASQKSDDAPGFADLLRDLALGLQRDIGFLVRLHDRLRAYEAPARPRL